MTDKISIYIIEDYLLTRKTYKHHFTRYNEFEVLGDFETAEEGLEAMKNRRADVVLMDLGLPYMNGLEATKIISRKFPQTKVIVLTSHDREEEIFASLSSGANAYSLKDISMPDLCNVIKEVHKGAVWIDSRIARMALSVFPEPESTDFDNLYITKEKLKVNLTEKELEILKLMVEGKSNTKIGDIMMISPHTAKSHVCKILSKLSVTDRVQAAVKAVRYDLLKNK